MEEIFSAVIAVLAMVGFCVAAYAFFRFVGQPLWKHILHPLIKIVFWPVGFLFSVIFGGLFLMLPLMKKRDEMMEILRLTEDEVKTLIRYSLTGRWAPWGWMGLSKEEVRTLTYPYQEKLKVERAIHARRVRLASDSLETAKRTLEKKASPENLRAYQEALEKSKASSRVFLKSVEFSQRLGFKADASSNEYYMVSIPEEVYLEEQAATAS